MEGEVSNVKLSQGFLGVFGHKDHRAAAWAVLSGESTAGAPGQVRAASASTNPGSKRVHLAGFGVHVPTGKEFLHNSHVLLCFHSGKGCQHDGGIPRLVLVIHVTYICKDTSLFREEPSPKSVSCPHELKVWSLEKPSEMALGSQSPGVTQKEM